MIKTKNVKVKIVPKNYNTYKKLNYNFKMGDEVEIDVKDLPLNSRKIIKVKCDNCDTEKSIKYCDYMKVYNKKNKYFCSNCRNESIKQGVKMKYGVDNVFQLQDTKDKTEKTNLKKYGVKHHLQNKDILEKQKKTNQERYGVDFIPELNRDTTESFIAKCKKIHGNKYDYSLVDYFRVINHVDIICKKHGKFSQLADSHVKGMGCPKCATSKGEEFIINYLNDRNIPYNYQKSFDGCVYKNKLPFDFYIPSMNLIIEYDGEQHFMVIENWGGEEEFKLRQIKDKIKTQYCKNNNIELLRIKYDEDLGEKLNNIF